jgi:hypothetical protein
LVIAGLSFYTTEEEFKNTFSPFGAVEEGTIPMLFRNCFILFSTGQLVPWKYVDSIFFPFVSYQL